MHSKNTDYSNLHHFQGGQQAYTYGSRGGKAGLGDSVTNRLSWGFSEETSAENTKIA
jgi:hypothetical protein